MNEDDILLTSINELGKPTVCDGRVVSYIMYDQCAGMFMNVGLIY